ncbi:MAG: hypothetical protein VXW15_04765 [Bdellovibrionota bacterium]|nr:hypothetical protein [Bdellovibrionota bacterium]
MNTFFEGKENLRKLFTLTLLISTLFLASCGKSPENQIVKDVNVNSSLEDGDVYVSFSSVFKIGAVSMTSIQLPIVDPRDSSIKYGEISFKPTLEPGHNEIGFKFNLTASSEVQGGYGTLPNGEDLPISGFGSTEIIELKIDKINSKLYLAFGKNHTLLGFAVVIKEFDVVGDAIPGANIFLGFDIKGVQGMAGLFSSQEEMQSGLGFFLDLSSVVSNDIINDIIDKKPITPEVFAQMQENVTMESITRMTTGDQEPLFTDVNASRRNLKKLNKAFKKLGKRKVNYARKD